MSPVSEFSRTIVYAMTLAMTALATGAAYAQTTLHVGKAQPNQFAFVPADVGIEIGAFAKRGLAVEISAFGGDARMIQALTASGVDIALGGGPALAALAKGAPAKAVAALANEPNTIMLVVLKDGPIKSVADLRGRRVSVSTAGSLTYWLTEQLSRAQGWGADGIAITPLGAAAAEVAALKTHQVDAVVTDSVTIYQLVEQGVGRILVKFGEHIADFHVHVIYASNKLIDRNSDALNAFLAGWFEAIAFMQDHKRQTIEIAAKRTGVSETVAAEGYGDTMPIFSRNGRFNPKALDVLASSFVDMKLMPAKPDMTRLITEAYLPK